MRDPPAALAGVLGKGWMRLPGAGAVGYHLAREVSCLADAGCGLVAPAVAGVLAPVLQEVEPPLINSQTCSTLLRGMNLPPVQGSMLYAGFPMVGGRHVQGNSSSALAPAGQQACPVRPQTFFSPGEKGKRQHRECCWHFAEQGQASG